jgi:catechol 2,3-dioxygenase-like lactoylglutathione lyase family enzyme
MASGPVVFDHIALAAARISDASPVVVGALGGVADSGAPSGDFRWGCWRFDGGGRIEVIEPRGADGFVHRFLAGRGPGIHHVTFKVPSLAEACARAEAHGYRIVGRDDSHPNWKTAFLHPKQALGIVVQLTESAAGKGPWRWEPPPAPESPPPPARILGLRLRARSAERARTQWERVLGGAPASGVAGELVYSWPGSPMRIAVEVEPGADEGPIAIEFASDRPIAVGADPVLGRFFLPWAPPPGVPLG